MKKVNPYEALSIVFLIVGIILLWFKIDSRGIIISSTIVIAAVILGIRIFRDKST